MTSLKEELLEKGNIIFPNRGTSMLPLLRAGKDVMIIEKRKESTRLKKKDAVLFERENGELVLHRISDVLDEGYMILGDNCINKEYVREDAVLGIMTGVIRNGKKCVNVTDMTYRLYVGIWTGLYPVRRVLMKAKAKIL